MATIDPLVVVALVAVGAGTALRVGIGRSQPLWLDETFTGAIAAQPSFADVGRQILCDVNAPLYYLIAHAWSLVFGLSNAALRFPAVVFSVVAPVLCLMPTPAIPRRVGLVWCIIVALWAPGLAYAQEARCYSLVFCLGVASTIAFATLLQTPTRRRAFTWAAIGSLAALAHYHALVLIAVQGMVLLAVHRRRAVSLWPAALVFVPLFGWLFVASDRIRAFTATGASWYGRMRIDDVFDVCRFVAGGAPVIFILFVMVAGIVLFVKLPKRARTSSDPGRHAATAAAATALASVTFVVALAFVRPSFTLRYLMPFEPGILLGFALAADALRCRFRSAPWVLVAFVGSGVFAAPVAAPPKIVNFEAASDALVASGTRTLAFFWDNPNNAVEAPSQLAILGGFFFRRRGIDVDVRPLVNRRGGDPNPRLLALAQGPHAGILWVYDKHIHDTAAAVFAPRIAGQPGWSCQNFGVGAVGVLACSRMPM